MRAKAASPATMLPLLMRIATLLPTHTRRSEESEALQQFSTPLGLAFVASVASAPTPADVVLEPSAGTGCLAIFADLAGASLVLNEFAKNRAGILAELFPAVAVTQFDAAHINGMATGHNYPAVPIFGVTPCPVTIFTFGMLLLTIGPVPRWLLVIPVIWSLIGGSAAILLAVPQDWLLLVSGFVAVPLIAVRDYRNSKLVRTA
jgi:hypothetical protein